MKSIDYLKSDKKQPTTLLSLDSLLGGGLSSGIIQLVGESKVGKTFLALQLTNIYCRLNKKVLFIDVKGDISNEIIETLNLTSYLDNNLNYVREGTFDAIEKTLDEFIEKNTPDLVIVDSLPAIVNKGYLNLESDGRKKGIKTDNYNTNYESRPLMLLVNKLKQLALQRNICFVFINEFRNKIDKRIGTIRKIYGPKALHYQSNTIIQINDKCSNSKLKDRFKLLSEQNIGMLLEFELFKSNNLKPNLKIPFFFRYGIGYCKVSELIIMLIDTENVAIEGSYYKFTKLGKTVKGISELYEIIRKNYFEFENAFQQELQDYYNNLTKC